MAFSIRLSDEERRPAESYAKLNSLSFWEAFKRALFEKYRMSMMLLLLKRLMQSI